MAVQGIAVQVEETCARTKAAWNKLGDDVKAAAQSVSAESLKVAEATKAQTAALADLRRASILSKDAKLDEASGTAILAAAQQKVAATSAAIAAAKQEEAAAVAAASEEEALSSNFMVAAFQRAALGVREGCTMMQEKLVETAETGNLSAEGMAAGFSGLGALLGGGILVGFLAHFMDETAKVNVQLGHLATQSGIAVGSLAGLREIVREMGGEWDPVATGLVKMDKALADSSEPSKALENALEGVGLSAKELKGLQPEEQLQRIAVAFAASGNAGNVASAAIAVFGRGGKALIPILKEQGAELGANIKTQGELTGVTEKSISASQEWTRNMAKLTEGFQNFGNFAVENVHFVLAAVDAGGAALRTVFEGIATAVVALGKEFFALGKTIWDAMHFNVAEMQGDLQQVIHGGIDAIKAGGADIAQAWRDNAKLWRAGAGAAGAAGAGAGSDADSGSGGGAGGKSGNAAAAGQGVSSGPQMNQGSAVDAARQKLVELATLQQNAENGFTQMDQFATAAANSQANAVLKIFQSIPAQVTSSYAKMATEIQQATLKMVQIVTPPLNSFVDHWLTSGQRMGAAFQKMYDQMAMSAINSLLKQAEKWAAHEVLITAAHLAGLATRKSADAGAAALSNTQLLAELSKWIAMEWAKVTHHVAANTAKTSSDAAAASAGAATAAAASTVQVAAQFAAAQSAAGMAAAVAAAEAASGGPIAAVAAGAMTYGAIAPYVSLAAYDQGGIMGHGKMGVNLSGADERVLDPKQTQQFERMVNQSTSTSSNSEVHFHDHSSWNGVDGASVEGMYKQHAAAGRRQMMRQLRVANQV